MKRKHLWLILLIMAVLLVILTAKFLVTSGSREYSSDLNQLHAQFNQDKGKVRLVMLLSPT